MGNHNDDDDNQNNQYTQDGVESFAPYEPTPTVPPFPNHGSERSISEPGFKRFTTIPTPKDVKDHHLFGVPLISPLTKQTLSDSTIQDFIYKAISEIEHEVKIYISPVTIKRERINYSWNDFYYSFGWLQVNCRPILEVQKLEVSIPSAFNSENFVEWPTAWLKLYREFGTIQLVPLTGSGSILVTQVSTGVSFPIRLFNADNFPQFWGVTYRAGFETDQIPYIIAELIEVISSIRILSLLSPILFPYNSYGLGMDGLSQSVSTPGPQWFAARIQQLTDEKDKLVESIRSFYNLGYSMSVLGG